MWCQVVLALQLRSFSKLFWLFWYICIFYWGVWFLAKHPCIIFSKAIAKASPGSPHEGELPPTPDLVYSQHSAASKRSCGVDRAPLAGHALQYIRIPSPGALWKLLYQRSPQVLCQNLPFRILGWGGPEDIFFPSVSILGTLPLLSPPSLFPPGSLQEPFVWGSLSIKTIPHICAVTPHLQLELFHGDKMEEEGDAFLSLASCLYCCSNG